MRGVSGDPRFLLRIVGFLFVLRLKGWGWDGQEGLFMGILWRAWGAVAIRTDILRTYIHT